VLIGLSAALLAAVMYGAAAIFQAIATRSVEAVHALDIRLLFRLLRVPSFDISLVLTLGGFVLHLIALRQLPLFLAQSGIAASLAVTAVLAVLVFHDHLNEVEWLAVGGVFVGLALLSLAAGDTGDDRGTTGLIAALIVSIVVMIVGAWFSHWLSGAFATGLLGLMAGVGYAVAGVSARILPGFGLSDLFGSISAYTLGVAGVVAFLLYSVSLQRGSVTVASAPMIAAQTILPAIAGIVLLGDTIRPGWWPAAALGFLLAGAAAAILVHSEGVRGYSVRSTAPEEEEDDDIQAGSRPRR
jgi:drug/metabolite transporter (DMT)-like permease